MLRDKSVHDKMGKNSESLEEIYLNDAFSKQLSISSNLTYKVATKTKAEKRRATPTDLAPSAKRQENTTVICAARPISSFTLNDIQNSIEKCKLSRCRTTDHRATTPKTSNNVKVLTTQQQEVTTLSKTVKDQATNKQYNNTKRNSQGNRNLLTVSPFTVNSSVCKRTSKLKSKEEDRPSSTNGRSKPGKCAGVKRPHNSTAVGKSTSVCADLLRPPPSTSASSQHHNHKIRRLRSTCNSDYKPSWSYKRKLPVEEHGLQSKPSLKVKRVYSGNKSLLTVEAKDITNKRNVTVACNTKSLMTNKKDASSEVIHRTYSNMRVVNNQVMTTGYVDNNQLLTTVYDANNNRVVVGSVVPHVTLGNPQVILAGNQQDANLHIHLDVNLGPALANKFIRQVVVPNSRGARSGPTCQQCALP